MYYFINRDNRPFQITISRIHQCPHSYLRDRTEGYCYQKALGVALYKHYLTNIFLILKLIFCSYNLQHANCDCSWMQMGQFPYYFTQTVSIEIRKLKKAKNQEILFFCKTVELFTRTCELYTIKVFLNNIKIYNDAWLSYDLFCISEGRVHQLMDNLKGKPFFFWY